MLTIVNSLDVVGPAREDLKRKRDALVKQRLTRWNIGKAYKRKKDSARNAAKAKVNEELHKVNVRLDVSAVGAVPGSNATLDLELAWFRRIDKEVPVKTRDEEDLDAQLDLSSELESYIPEKNTSDIDSDADMELGY
ncbi:hypothetical protein K443DRAFT_6851 [Laccaria amethystina LaAM-08-1]|uniref:Uncharacterized protein n=1 Tax=Laccaria amethystina LaAM-08-1 TaxID=1095629 RepID=A0A0C9XV27_9AGAR|nr:hypothetical protein K443DRAFT_6851 [Laccaria amethystina LaAM-08-1]